jgi:hypothetical protein
MAESIGRVLLWFACIVSAAAGPGAPRGWSHAWELRLEPARVRAAAEPGGDDAVYSLKGVVVNSTTGEPIRNALVQVYLNGQRSALTGPDGKFKFDGLPYGEAAVMVRKPGFFSEEEIRSFSGGQHIVFTGPDSEPLVVKLVPEGVIYGRISGDDGEGIEGLPIQLLVSKIREGRKTVDPVHEATTDEEGAFRIAELQPGTYFMHVGPSRGPVSFLQRGAQLGAEGYPGIFYPIAADVETAAPIPLEAGKQMEINMSMQMQPFYRVSGNVSGSGTGQRVTLEFFDAAGEPAPVNPRFEGATGNFEVRWMPAGSYTLHAMAVVGQTRALSTTVAVNVNGDTAGVHANLLEQNTIPIRVRAVYTKTDSWRPPEGQENNLVYVGLTSKSNLLARIQIPSQLAGEGGQTSLELQNVSPGTYEVLINPNGPMYVQSAASGTLNLLENDLTVPPGGSVPPIEIVLRDDVANLTGKVLSDGQPVAATIVALPRQGAIFPRVQPTQADGTFEFGLLPPGDYKILAVDRADELEYRNPEVMQKYLSKVQEITLSPDQTARMDLELVMVQP